MKISVAMATFNGEKFLAEQLNSLSGQSRLPFELVACDDGSTDRTVDILRSFAETAPFPVRIFQNETNLGFADNFFKAAKLCSGDWISFCDQDDVWLPNKLSYAYAELKQNSKLALILQNAFICDGSIKSSGRIFPNSISFGFHPPQSQFGFWVWLGCLQTFRASFLKTLDSSSRPRNYFADHPTMSHDKWTCLIANATGGVKVLSEPAALYRRHVNALTGDYAAQGWKTRIEKALPVGADHYSFLAETASETAEYLKRLANSADDQLATDLLQSACRFDDLSVIQKTRAELYSEVPIFSRIKLYLKIVLRGGYVGPPMIALGWKSGAKDMFCVFGLLGERR